MRDPGSAKEPWVADLPSGLPAKDDFARLVEADQARDIAEVEYYEHMADPQFTQLEAQKRRFRSEFRRRLRHLEARARPKDQP